MVKLIKIMSVFLITIISFTLLGCESVDDLSNIDYSELEQEISERDDIIDMLELKNNDNEKRNSVLVSENTSYGRKIAEMEQRISHLEAAFDRSSPESVADLWGQAMTTRNGALVYALYLDDSEEKPRHDRSDSSIWETGWHMGGSNPHFVRYKVSTKTTNADGTISIEVILSSELSGADPIDDTITLNLVKIDENGWYIVSEVW